MTRFSYRSVKETAPSQRSSDRQRKKGGRQNEEVLLDFAGVGCGGRDVGDFGLSDGLRICPDDVYRGILLS